MANSGGSRPSSPWSYVGLGFEIVVPVLIGIFIGYRLDLWLETAPWLMVVGAFAGIALSFYSLFRRVLGERRRDG